MTAIQALSTPDPHQHKGGIKTALRAAQGRTGHEGDAGSASGAFAARTDTGTLNYKLTTSHKGVCIMTPKKPTRGPKPAATRATNPPSPPAWLTRDQKQVFVETGVALAAAGLIRDCDTGLLASYACALCGLRKSTLTIDALESEFYTGPNGAICCHPALKVRSDMLAKVATLAAALGCGSCARKRAGGGTTPPTATATDGRPKLSDFVRFPGQSQ